ncbi:hypothetical protein DFH07DRAFT_780608 [Mycena maculata]|uniref:Uncharacterized protein n=1 Tax=Mycena maculata TaxID=230809 RepID=A0AAD7I235_9AGAR|nr:hypothetical protein DFH07DRAFT_780608 [Mycena maculata]
MNKKLPGWENEGWLRNLKSGTARTIFKVAAPGSPERAQCRKASTLAKGSARTSTEEQWDLTLPPDTALPGLPLQGNHQCAFYDSIREIKSQALSAKPSTLKMLETVRKDMETVFGRYITEAGIWWAVVTKDLLLKTAQFLWKELHNAHRIGMYWTHIPECEDRTTCQECGILEDLNYILLGFTSPGQEIIWCTAESLWREKEDKWPAVLLGTISGCGLVEFRDENGKVKRGTQRLYQILISKSTYLIWRLRNERVISGGRTPATEEEIKNRWKYQVN